MTAVAERETPAVRPRQRGRWRAGRLYLPTFAMAALTGWLSWRGWMQLGPHGAGDSIAAGRYQMAGPIVLAFVGAVFAIEQLRPAQRRPVLARGHLLDMPTCCSTRRWWCSGSTPWTGVPTWPTTRSPDSGGCMPCTTRRRN